MMALHSEPAITGMVLCMTAHVPHRSICRCECDGAACRLNERREQGGDSSGSNDDCATLLDLCSLGPLMLAIDGVPDARVR